MLQILKINFKLPTRYCA